MERGGRRGHGGSWGNGVPGNLYIVIHGRGGIRPHGYSRETSGRKLIRNGVCSRLEWWKNVARGDTHSLLVGKIPVGG